MKALILYVLFVTIAALISTGIGYYVEIEFSSTASLIVFLALFFANFAVSWLAVILVMDGTLKDAQGRQSQLDIEKSGSGDRASGSKRNRNPRGQQNSHSASKTTRARGSITRNETEEASALRFLIWPTRKLEPLLSEFRPKQPLNDV
jgi:hypothetical protein